MEGWGIPTCYKEHLGGFLGIQFGGVQALHLHVRGLEGFVWVGVWGGSGVPTCMGAASRFNWVWGLELTGCSHLHGSACVGFILMGTSVEIWVFLSASKGIWGLLINGDLHAGMWDSY